MEIIFPLTCQPTKYYKSHVRYVMESAHAAGLTVRLRPEIPASERKRFKAILDGREILFDFDDFTELTPDEIEHPRVFKFHTTTAHPPNIHPFPPISFYDWSTYQALEGALRYTAEGNRIICRQRLYGEGKDRRKRVQTMLRKAYRDVVLTFLVPQQKYWREVSDCLTHVFVPGAREDILDRGMLQWLAFGVCVIAPKTSTRLPFGRKLENGVHFVECRGDYTDLLEKVEWCREHREACKTIGAAAKELFQSCCTPERAWTWVSECLGGRS